jgi:hypothetical protein
VKLFNYPCVVKYAPFRAQEWEDGAANGVGIGYAGHSSHVVNIRFSHDGRRVISVGGNDQAVFQWRVDPVAKEQVRRTVTLLRRCCRRTEPQTMTSSKSPLSFCWR